MTTPAEILASAVARLASADARDEVLAQLTERKLLGIPRGQTFVLVERVWRLGMLLLGRSGALYATGQTIRIDAPRFDNHQSNLAAERRAVRELALRSGVAAGDTLNWDARAIDLAHPEHPVVAGEGGLQVRWTPADPAALVPFESYVAERVELLADPPRGA